LSSSPGETSSITDQMSKEESKEFEEFEEFRSAIGETYRKP